VGKIEEYIQIIGADRAEQELARLAGAQQQVGDTAEDAGKKSQQAGGQTTALGSALTSAASAAQSFVAGFIGLAGVQRLLSEVAQSLREVDELNRKLGGGAVDVASRAKILARQLGVGEEKGAEILTSLQIAGGLEAGGAQELGVAADIAFEGKLLEGKNLTTTKDVAAFAGTMGFTGSETANLFGFLKTAGKLGSPEEAKEAIAKIAAAARASKAKSTGAFVEELARGGTGILQSGVSLEDVLAMGAQARQVEVSEELAAQSLASLEQVAVGAEKPFTREIERRAREQGLDAKALTTAQRIGIARQIFGGITTQEEEDRVRKMLSAERGQRLIKAFRGSTVVETAGVGEAVETAGVEQFEGIVAQGRGELSFRQAQNRAAMEFEQYLSGREMATYKMAYDRAQAKAEEMIAGGQVDLGARIFGGTGRERLMLQLFQQRMEELRLEGVDVSGIQEAIGDVGMYKGRFGGYSDEALREIARAIDEAVRKASAENKATVNVQVTNIGTAYYDEESGRHSPIPVDVSH
jgi:hypothetical protein